MTYRTPVSEFSASEDKHKVGNPWAKNLIKYQIGLMLYDMTIGLTGQHGLSDAENLVDAQLTKELNFDYPCFATKIGQAMKSHIQALAHLDPECRPEIHQVRAQLEGFRYENEPADSIEKEPVAGFFKEKFKDGRSSKQAIIEDEFPAPSLLKRP